MIDYLILIILHLIGDFYFQSTKVARCKMLKQGRFAEIARKNVIVVRGVIGNIF